MTVLIFDISIRKVSSSFRYGEEKVMNITVGVTADDFGYCQRRNKAVVELCRYGVIGRLSLIVNATECCDAVSTFRALPMESKSSIKVGLHLNLTEGRPISKPSFVQSLVDDNGNFLGKMGLREKLATVSESEVRIEKEKNRNDALFMFSMRH